MDPLSPSSFETTRQRLDGVSPSFCLAKWKNVTLHLHNGHSQSCHHVPSHKAPLDSQQPNSLHNTPLKKQARQQMLKGERPNECQYCWKVEDQGQLSDRVLKSHESTYMDFFDEVVESKEGSQVAPSFLEIAFDNRCQFRCMYCNPAYSTQWEKEVAQWGDYPTWGNRLRRKYNQSRRPLSDPEQSAYQEQFWRWWPEIAPKLRYLRLTGGEPFLSPQAQKLMEKLNQKPHPHLNFAINTNLGVPTKTLKIHLERLKGLQSQLASLVLFTSIDCVGKRAEYIRFGLDESLFDANIEFTLKALPKATLCFMITVNNLSLSGLQPLLEKIHNLKLRFPNHEIQIDTPYLRQPEHLSIEILSEDFKVYAENAYEWAITNGTFRPNELKKLKRLPSLVNNPELPKWKKFLLRQDFLKFIKEYDKRKQLDSAVVFPEYEDFFRLCGSPKRNWQSFFVDKGI